MAKAEVFESLQPEQIPPYNKDSLGISSISLEDEDDNIENIKIVKKIYKVIII